MRILYSAVLVTIITLIFGCQKEVNYVLSGNNNNNNNNLPASFRGTLQGNIVDENGKAVIGANIKAGDKTAVTDARGYFRIKDAQLSTEGSMVSAEKSGYFKAFRTFNATSGANQVKIKLIPKKLAGTISAAAGGTVTLTNGTGIALQSNGVMKAAGSQAYSGTINVYSTYIDPTATDISSIVPGSFLGRDKENKEVVLTSYGMLAVELESTSGEKLQIASGKTATLTMPIPSTLLGAAPATIPLWFVDEQTGIWKEEGAATKTGNNYIGEVKHFTYWNCDVSGPRVNLTATFLAPQGIPVVHAEVHIRSAGSNYGSAHGFTDSLGQICGPVPANTLLTLEVVDPCRNVLYTRNIGPFTADANIGTINLSNSATSGLVVVRGKLTNCNNAPVTNGFAIIYFDNTVRYANVSSTGEFLTSFTRCNSSPLTAEVVGVDKTTTQQGATVNATITSSTNDLGTISACGSSSLEFVNYTLDGTAHSISNLDSDSLSAYPGNATSAVSILASGSGTTDNISFRFNHNSAAGTFDLDELGVQDFVNVTLILPFTITLTNYPQAPGQFYEGHFTGQFTSTQTPGVTHNISCSFRTRRMY